MSRRTFFLGFLAVALGAVLAVQRYVPREYRAKYLAWVVPADGWLPAAAPSDELLAPSVAERLARIDGRLRLPPDARAIAAIGEIRRLVHGGAAADAEASYAGGSWKVTHGGQTVGMLSDFPRFSALLSLLDEVAIRERARPGAVELAREPAIRPELQKRLNRFDDAAAFEVLAQVDAAWSKRRASVGDLLAATEALAQLCALLPSDVPAADALATRAFASLALARQVAPERTQRAEIRLAFATGYVTHARTLADQLPFGEPLAAFVRADLDSLERAAGERYSHEARFLYGSRLVSAASSQDWITWYRELPRKRKRAPRAAIVRTALEDPSVSTANFVPDLYAARLLKRFGAPLAKGDPPARALTRCDALSERVEEKARQRTGPFSDRALYGSAYRAACLSAVYRKLVFFIESTEHPDLALAVARSQPESARPDLAALRDWTELVAGDAAQSRDPARIASALANPELGVLQREALARRAFAALAPDDARRSDVADAAAAQLDSRPAGRLFAAELARDVYRDPDLEERLYRAAVDVDGLERATLASRAASLRRDWRALWAMAESDEYRLEERAAALGALEKQVPLEAARLRRGYERLLVANADYEPLRWQFAGFLEKALGERKRARFVLMHILTAREQGDPAAADAVADEIARLYLEDGDARAAWALVEPRLARTAVPAMAVRAQIALGNLARAEEIARAAQARDPRSLASAAELAAVLWEASRNAEAAELIAALRTAGPARVRCWNFCRAFVRTFQGPPSAEVEAAFAALVAARLDEPLLLGTLAAFREHGQAETAVALAKQLDGPKASIHVRVESYKSLREWRGEAAAITWLKPKIPREKLGSMAKVFYARGADELLWKLVDDPDRQGGSATWLLRAAAFVREPEPSPAHRAALAGYFGAHQETPDEQLGAALVGLIDADELLARARSEAELSRVAYFLGARAESERDLHGAMRLYQLALASPRRSHGRNLAHAAVTRIEQLDTSLDALAAEPAPLAAVAARR